MASKEIDENVSLIFNTCDDPRWNFYYDIEGASCERTIELLEKSWTKSPLDTMKLIFNLRDIRHGKGFRPQSLICLRWLYQKQFENLLLNLNLLHHFGCWKDYLNLLMIAFFDILPYDWNYLSEFFPQNLKIPQIRKYDQIIIKSFPKEKRRELENTKTICHQVQIKYRRWNNQHWIKKKKTVSEIEEKFGKFDYKSKSEYFKVDDQKRKMPRPFLYYKFKTNKQKLRKLIEYRREYFQKKYEEDIKFKQLYDRIVDLFAKQLFQDYLNYNEQHYEFISLVAKWMPNSGRYFDKYLFIVSSVSKKFFQLMKQSSSSPNSIDTDRMLKNEKLSIRKLSKICTQLREQLKVPEISMSSNDWNKLDYRCVPSKAMRRYSPVFIKRDSARLNQFNSSTSHQVRSLTPAHLIKKLHENELFQKMLGFLENIPSVFTLKQLSEMKVLENQWRSLVNEVKSSESLMCKINTLVICKTGIMMDLSAKQYIKPAYAAIGLTKFLWELKHSYWNHCFILYSDEPSIQKVDPNKRFLEQYKQILRTLGNIWMDLNPIFELILKTAIDEKLSEDQMPKILFIFCDSDYGTAQKHEVNYDFFREEFKKAGYQFPLIVFWDLRASENKSTLVRYHQDKLILMSGYLPTKFEFLFSIKNITDFAPMMVLERIINDPRYDCVKII